MGINQSKKNIENKIKSIINNVNCENELKTYLLYITSYVDNKIINKDNNINITFNIPDIEYIIKNKYIFNDIILENIIKSNNIKLLDIYLDLFLNNFYCLRICDNCKYKKLYTTDMYDINNMKNYHKLKKYYFYKMLKIYFPNILEYNKIYFKTINNCLNISVKNNNFEFIKKILKLYHVSYLLKFNDDSFMLINLNISFENYQILYDIILKNYDNGINFYYIINFILDRDQIYNINIKKYINIINIIIKNLKNKNNNKEKILNFLKYFLENIKAYKKTDKTIFNFTQNCKIVNYCNIDDTQFLINVYNFIFENLILLKFYDKLDIFIKENLFLKVNNKILEIYFNKLIKIYNNYKLNNKINDNINIIKNIILYISKIIKINIDINFHENDYSLIITLINFNIITKKHILYDLLIKNIDITYKNIIYELFEKKIGSDICNKISEFI